MPTLAALPDASLSATIREVAADPPVSLRPLGLRADEIARRALRLLLKKTSIDTAAEALSLLGLPSTPASLAVLRSLGFTGDDYAHLDPALRQQIVTALESGVWSPQVIAHETGCTVEQVNEVLISTRLLPYGSRSGRGRCRKVSARGREVLRRVSLSGQITYDGKRYCVGRGRSVRVARVREDGGELEVRFGDWESVRVAVRV